jgi:hypothetical protein
MVRACFVQDYVPPLSVGVQVEPGRAEVIPSGNC